LLLWLILYQQDQSQVKKKTEHKVSTNDLSKLYENSFIGVTVHRGFEVLYTNQKVAKILGYESARSMLKTGDLSCHIPRRRQGEISARWAAIEGGEVKPERNRVSNITCDGHEVWLDITDERIVWEDGKPAILSTLYDVSTAVSTNASLLSSLRHLEVSLDSILETVPTGIAIFSDIGEPKTVNSAMRLLFQASPSESDYVPRAMSDLLAKLVNSDQQEMTERGVETRMNKVVDLVARRMSDDAIMMCAADVSDWKYTQDELKTLAERDSLTKLFNRRGFVDTVRPMLTHSVKKKQDFAVIIVDIDFFKAINDTHGHAAGDNALKSFSKRISKALRNRDIVGRIGGEEFAIFLPDSNLDTAQRIAERLRIKIAKNPINIDQLRVPMTASFGLKVWEGGDKNPRLKELLEDADSALYRAKQAGRNRVALA
jgi:diguanylate cyclase (GGDEF)-like protein/PAS domain S-box-containing protein